MKKNKLRGLLFFAALSTLRSLLFFAFLVSFFCCSEREPEKVEPRLNYLEIEPIKSAKYALRGEVTKVSDGDTFSFRVARGDSNLKNKKDTVIRVRSHGIDAPESDQPYGEEAMKFLRDNIMGRNDVVVYMTGAITYNRLVGIAYVDEKDINYETLKLGYAWHYKNYDNSPHYISAVENAKQNKLGLWKGKNPLNPYRWRKMSDKEKKIYKEENGYD